MVLEVVEESAVVLVLVAMVALVNVVVLVIIVLERVEESTVVPVASVAPVNVVVLVIMVLGIASGGKYSNHSSYGCFVCNCVSMELCVTMHAGCFMYLIYLHDSS